MTKIQAESGPLCQKLFALGLDMFKSAQVELGIDDLNEDKLRNIVTCEKKRLHRFANEFPHEQHLLNLQSLLIASLVKLAQLLANQTASVSEFRCQLARIAVLIDEVDAEAAKAKRRKRFELIFNEITNKELEEIIKLAAEKYKDNSSYKTARLNEYRLGQLHAQAEQAKKLKEHADALAKHTNLVAERAAKAMQILYREHILKLAQPRIELRIRQILEQKALRQIIDQMELEPATRNEVMSKALTELKLKPY